LQSLEEEKEEEERKITHVDSLLEIKMPPFRAKL
jgi:hypothetical protein